MVFQGATNILGESIIAAHNLAFSRRKRLTPLSKNFLHFHFKNPFLLNDRGEPVRAVTRKEGGKVP